ncbi:DUF2785 domain-containing protein [Arthrobacter rhombi]|uniref:DUF2785 domain-containing protein n=1 Tax=Arthrobacter rhombi TaxID=71253 RepID=UPI003FD07326
MPPSKENVSDVGIIELLEDLSSPDPTVRDGESLGRLCELVDRGHVSEAQLAFLGATLVERLSHDRVEARSFAALALVPLILRDVCPPGWFPHFASWYASEADITGYDMTRGWLHAVAHRADVLGAIGWKATESPRPVLDLAVRRMLHQGPGIWRDQEDDRLGFSIAITLANPHLNPADALEWVEPVEKAFLRGEPGPVPAFVSNSIRTLRVVALLVGEQMTYEGHTLRVQYPTALRRRLREVLHHASPWMWNLQGPAGRAGPPAV